MDYPFPERLRSYREETFFALEVGEGFTLRAARNRLAGMSLTNDERNELSIIDGMVIESIIELDEVADYLLNDDETQPLADWWWHLGKIRQRTYPADLLPPHLRAVYLDSEGEPKAA